MVQNGKPHLLDSVRKVRLLPHRNGHAPPPADESNNPSIPESNIPSPVAPASEPSTIRPSTIQLSTTSASLRPFHEALRDRLITFFEVKNLTHKPKLVSVTSCAEGSGVTTIASGLAAALSETGDGNVLLVDMNQEGAAQQFYQGKLACGLDDALELEKRGNAMVQDNLYVVTEANNSDKLPRILPKRFTHLVPRLKASDYDYIIFDLPPISQISFTPRLVRFMDMVLLVVEAEKTDRDLVKRATALVSESKANMGVVLNKARTYVPQRLHQEVSISDLPPFPLTVSSLGKHGLFASIYRWKTVSNRLFTRQFGPLTRP